ncbi:DUF4180 domain-containing protein [Parapedobacter lycopersici]|uniref:DUF4180 domain-containing protein n=1 Tax=Parapedobacter lycopersici TaxID=1864939 RepID=UPI00214D7199|nr:DUF4180 domain-containing protein [Parapedobacter lycopersici]
MNIVTHLLGNNKVAEVVTDEILLHHAADGLDLMGNLYYQGFDSIVIHQKNITPAFFDLQNGIAGELLQKFSNYRVRLAIVGDFDRFPSKSLRDFIYESNKGRIVNFVASTEAALEKLALR